MNDKFKVQEFTDEFIKSTEFLKTYEWRRVRKYVLVKYGGKCMCCGKSVADGIVLNVDHIEPRKTHPELALDKNNLQILCNECNHGKGNWNTTDWRGNASFVVTEKWLNEFKTLAGGMTDAQVKALTGKTKPKKGWKDRLIGTTISQATKLAYEQGRDIYSKRTLQIREQQKQDKEKQKLRKEIELLQLKVEIKRLEDELK